MNASYSELIEHCVHNLKSGKILEFFYIIETFLKRQMSTIGVNNVDIFKYHDPCADWGSEVREMVLKLQH